MSPIVSLIGEALITQNLFHKLGWYNKDRLYDQFHTRSKLENNWPRASCMPLYHTTFYLLH